MHFIQIKKANEKAKLTMRLARRNELNIGMLISLLSLNYHFSISLLSVCNFCIRRVHFLHVESATFAVGRRSSCSGKVQEFFGKVKELSKFRLTNKFEDVIIALPNKLNIFLEWLKNLTKNAFGFTKAFFIMY